MLSFRMLRGGYFCREEGENMGLENRAVEAGVPKYTKEVI